MQGARLVEVCHGLNEALAIGRVPAVAPAQQQACHQRRYLLQSTSIQCGQTQYAFHYRLPTAVPGYVPLLRGAAWYGRLRDFDMTAPLVVGLLRLESG